MYCYNCMRNIEDDSTFCEYCGKSTAKQIKLNCLSPGTVLNNRYLVGNSIGEGGFGITYVGLDTNLNLKVAIKEFYPSGYANRNNTVSNEVTMNTQNKGEYFRNGRQHFLHEAQNIAKFSNEDGIVDVRDYFTENGTAYIIMEYVDGYTLSDYINKNGLFSPENILSLMLPIMKSLQKMHGEGIIHRDISPENIMYTTDGRLKLMDFGSARYFSVTDQKTLSVMLKPGYAPYEQYSAKGNQGPWTDVYGLCATMYKCVTGKTPVDSLDRIQSDSLQPPSVFRLNVSQAFDNMVMYGLAVYPQNRCQDMEELIRIATMAIKGKKTSFRTADAEALKNQMDLNRQQDERYKTVYQRKTYGDDFNNQNGRTVGYDEIKQGYGSGNGYGNGHGSGYGNGNGYQSEPKSSKAPLIATLSIVGVLIVAAVVSVFVFMNPFESNSDTTATTEPATAEATNVVYTTEVPATEPQTEGEETFTMESVVDKYYSEAESILEDKGLKVKKVEVENPDTDCADGKVYKQSPGAGVIMSKGDSVELYVVKLVEETTAPEPTTSPSEKLEFTKISASSELPSEGGNSYSVKNLLQRDGKCWSENADGYGIGEYVLLTNTKTQHVDGMKIINGYTKNSTTYYNNSRVKTIRFEFSDGTSIRRTVMDTMAEQRISFDRTVDTQYVKMIIEDVYEGDEYSDTCLSFVGPY